MQSFRMHSRFIKHIVERAKQNSAKTSVRWKSAKRKSEKELIEEQLHKLAGKRRKKSGDESELLKLELDKDQATKLLKRCRSKDPVIEIPDPCECGSRQTEKVFDHSVDLFNKGIYCAKPCESTESLEQPRVVIIGAGMAGIAAAARLSEHGIHNYVILEAHDRIGGRINSVFVGDVVAELGAQWRLETCCNHPVFQLQATEDPARPGVPAVSHRGLFIPTIYGSMKFAPTFKAYNRFKQILQEADSLYCLGGAKQHGSMLNFLSLRIQQELHSFPEEHQHDAARVMFGLVHLYTTRGGPDCGTVVHDNNGCYMHVPGSELRVPLGVIGVMSHLLRQVRGTIRTCKPVNCVYWGTCVKSGHRAIVTCTDGDEFPADYVLVTVPLGVLCYQSAKLFCPALPSTKMDAVRSMGFGYCDKIFLQYCCPFWMWQTTGLDFNLCPSQGDCPKDWTAGITAIRKVPGSNYVICIWVVSQAAAVMEGMSDRDVSEGITKLLRSKTGANIPYPCCVVRSRWATDQYFCGSFSYDFQCADGTAQRMLADPLPGSNETMPPILLFAGEHTCPGQSATVAGARISGIREADRILQLTLQFKGPPTIYTADTFKHAEVNTCASHMWKDMVDPDEQINVETYCRGPE